MGATAIAQYGWVAVHPPGRPPGRVFFCQVGHGPDLALVTGLWDGLYTPRGLAVALGWLAGPLQPHFRITLLGSREALAPGLTTEQMAADAAALAGTLGLAPHAVIGFSFGGLVAQRMALGAPHLVPALVLLSSPLGGTDGPTLSLFWEHLLRLARAGRWTATHDHLASLLLSPELRHHLGWRWRLFVRLARAPRQLDHLIRQVDALRHDRGAAPAALRSVPTLVVAGAQDVVLGLRWSDPRLAGARRRIWLAGQHGAFLDQWPLVTAELLRFIEEATQAAPAQRAG